MDTLFSLKVFCQIVEQGSFTRAAEQLGISAPMASKHLTHLEKQLATRLLHRNSRRLHLSEEGDIYYRQCREALDLLENAAAQAGLRRAKAYGHLRIAVPVWCANPMFADWIAQYRTREPDVTLDIVLDNRMNDLIGEGFDLALRFSSNPAPSLIMRPLFDVAFMLVASPTWIAAHGMPRTPQEAAQHTAVLPSYTDISHWHARHGEEETAIHLSAGLQSNNTLMLRELILAGGGIGYLPHILIIRDLENGRLQTLLPDYRFPSITLHAVYAERRHLSAKIRSFIDFMVEIAKEMRERYSGYPKTHPKQGK